MSSVWRHGTQRSWWGRRPPRKSWTRGWKGFKIIIRSRPSGWVFWMSFLDEFLIGIFSCCPWVLRIFWKILWTSASKYIFLSKNGLWTKGLPFHSLCLYFSDLLISYPYLVLIGSVNDVITLINFGFRLEGTGQNCGLVSRNRPVSTGFYKGFSVSFLVLDGKKVLYLQVEFNLLTFSSN